MNPRDVYGSVVCDTCVQVCICLYYPVVVPVYTPGGTNLCFLFFSKLYTVPVIPDTRWVHTGIHDLYTGTFT